MKLYIRAMATADRQIEDRLVNRSHPLVEHLIKVILYPDSQYVRGWIKEIYSFISHVDKSKRHNKYPSEKFIYKAISSHNDIVDNMMCVVKSKMRDSGLIPREYTEANVVKMVDNYLKWLASQLAENGYVDHVDAQNAVKFYCKVR